MYEIKLTEDEAIVAINALEALGEGLPKLAKRARKQGNKEAEKILENTYFICMKLINKITIQQERETLKSGASKLRSSHGTNIR